MNKFTFTKTFFSVLFLSLLVCGEVCSQGTPWNGTFGNEWLQGKYNQKWLRIGVTVRGVHRVTLPAGFLSGADPAKLRLFHRGLEVALLKANTTEIEFYGLPNDGSSDSLLYRPTSSRINPYYSMYSDESSYFLTIDPDNGKRAVTETISDATGANVLTSHDGMDRTVYSNQYTHASQVSLRPTNLNSFMEEGQTRTGTALDDNAADTIYSAFPIALKKRVGNDPVTVKILMAGRSDYIPNGANPRNFHIYIGQSASTLRHDGQISVSGFNYGEYSFTVQPGDLSPTNEGRLGFRSDAPLQALYYDYFSVTYYAISYKQEIDMRGLASYEFNFPAAAQGTKNKIVVTTPASNAKFYDVSDPYNVRIINGPANNLIFTRPNGKPLKLWASNVTTIVAPAKITSTQFSVINKADYDYLIISNDVLLSASDSLAKYRKVETPGRKFKTGVFKIRDLYNQFNYGEPSPLAIRRFVDYMISDGNKDRFLMLMGKSVTRNDRITKELPNEVPTFAFPGSDILLIEGLQGTPKDVPAIPVGRLPAVVNADALAYLDKVKSYEKTSSGIAWKRNVIHLSGGKTQAEIDDHSANLANVAGMVTNPAKFKGNVVALKRTDLSDPLNGQQLDTLYKYVNPGVGMITYFGHSAPYRTDYNFGYVSDPAKQFNNPGKYPIMFYNGCDILNVFSNNFATTVNESTSRPQSLDWLLTANKGAVAVFGNTWAGYASSCNNYLQRIYAAIFNQSDKDRKSIGEMMKDVALQTKLSAGYRVGYENARLNIEYIADQAQIHQTLLLGDPALRVLISTEGGLPVDLVSFSAKLATVDQVDVAWKTASETNNSHFVLERSYNGKNFETLARIEGKGNTSVETTYTFRDSKPLPGVSYYRLKQVDVASIDAEGNEVEGKSTLSRIVSVEREGTSLLKVYPNPSSDVFNIRIDAPVSLSKWSVVDNSGKIRRTGSGDSADLSNLPTGSYTLKIVTSNNDVYFKKVIKK
ncbi:C25 family cysteine peptidase [Dyadobacter sp. CY261]|uniref:putative type IX secretion system sortase PorU2 n=1 Tax=Dyadobacter sp. CY261 TaxID=2907203 RepID=UPI001F1A8DED|nr:C25 family cysteine peptidase [Dyadobacter sp. CY261]MCF0071851.1 C25 family cysteine peptidase [Dyadobacter sp. CY261]